MLQYLRKRSQDGDHKFPEHDHLLFLWCDQMKSFGTFPGLPSKVNEKQEMSVVKLRSEKSTALVKRNEQKQADSFYFDRRPDYDNLRYERPNNVPLFKFTTSLKEAKEPSKGDDHKYSTATPSYLEEGDFVPLDSEESDEKVCFNSILQQQKALHAHVSRNPGDVLKWLELVDYQKRFLRIGNVSDVFLKGFQGNEGVKLFKNETELWERQLEILDRGLRSCLGTCKDNHLVWLLVERYLRLFWRTEVTQASIRDKFSYFIDKTDIFISFQTRMLHLEWCSYNNSLDQVRKEHEHAASIHKSLRLLLRVAALDFKAGRLSSSLCLLQCQIALSIITTDGEELLTELEDWFDADEDIFQQWTSEVELAESGRKALKVVKAVNTVGDDLSDDVVLFSDFSIFLFRDPATILDCLIFMLRYFCGISLPYHSVNLSEDPCLVDGYDIEGFFVSSCSCSSFKDLILRNYYVQNKEGDTMLNLSHVFSACFLYGLSKNDENIVWVAALYFKLKDHELGKNLIESSSDGLLSWWYLTEDYLLNTKDFGLHRIVVEREILRDKQLSSGNVAQIMGYPSEKGVNDCIEEALESVGKIDSTGKLGRYLDLKVLRLVLNINKENIHDLLKGFYQPILSTLNSRLIGEIHSTQFAFVLQMIFELGMITNLELCTHLSLLLKMFPNNYPLFKVYSEADNRNFIIHRKADIFIKELFSRQPLKLSISSVYSCWMRDGDYKEKALTLVEEYPCICGPWYNFDGLSRSRAASLNPLDQRMHFQP